MLLLIEQQQQLLVVNAFHCYDITTSSGQSNNQNEAWH